MENNLVAYACCNCSNCYCACGSDYSLYVTLGRATSINDGFMIKGSLW